LGVAGRLPVVPRVVSLISECHDSSNSSLNGQWHDI
jgi:hypothetical protein